jgi:UDP-glucose 4-epimerase
MAKCLVTGGAGFIGSHISLELKKQGHDVMVLDKTSVSNLETQGIEVVRGSITDLNTVENATKGVDYVFHEAALVSVAESMTDPEKTRLVNVIGSRNVLDAALKNGTKKVILASSAAVYGDSPPPLSETAEKKPLSPYGESKLEMEHLASEYKEKGLNTISLRYFNVYGPFQSTGSPYSGVISKFIQSMLENKKVIIYGDGGQTRDFIYVKDVVNANILSMESKAGGCFNIATGRQTSIKELSSVIAELLGKIPEIEMQDEREGDIKHSYADVSKAKELLDFEAEYSLKKGLEKTIEWMKS